MLDPHKKLAGVEFDLVNVMQAASQTPQPFQVVYGLRTIEEEKKAVAAGHSTTMHSRHLPNLKGFACAVDVAAIINGVVSFAHGDEERVFGHIAVEVKAAAKRLGVPIEWGGEWVHFRDWGHFQLPWAQYP